MTIAETIMEKVKKLPVEKQEATLRFVDSLEPNDDRERQRAFEKFAESVRKGFLKGPLIPFNREEIYDREAR
jgi:hypothetical protein